MGQSANLYGPPGAGKTRKLISIAEAVVREHGPQALGAVTFTRSAAAELKSRLAPLVGASPDSQALLDRVFPYVGTIHSLCYRLSGRPKVISNAHKLDWARHAGDQRAHFDGTDTLARLDTFDLGDQPHSAAEWALDLYSAARQRRILPEDMLRLRPTAEVSVDTLLRYIASYEGFKREMELVDFDDLLDLGTKEVLPVTYLLVDEAQDNSRMLWSVIDAWRRRIDFTVCAGDPWQALFVFSGGDPALFRSQPGGWTTIGDSHRLSPTSAAYAQRVLKTGGYSDDPLLDQWGGAANGQGVDGLHFWLARTGRLVHDVAQMLEDRGEPYTFLSGRGGPLTATATAPWRAAYEMLDDGSTTASNLHRFVAELPKGLIDPSEQRRIRLLSGRVHTEDIDWADHLPRLMRTLPKADYYARIVSRYGLGGLVMPPANRVGTIHSAKGREADFVTLVRSWGSLPAQAMLSGEKSETCVAYVGVSRHRVGLDFLDLPRSGIDYPFPRA
jgi:superfamily I DNA/RNA helicase